MPLTFGTGGLQIQTYEEILAEVQADFRSRISTSIATKLKSAAGQLQRIIALREYEKQEKLQQLVQAIDPRLAEGALLDQRNSLLGISRLPDEAATVLGTFTGTATTVVPDGFRVSVGGYVFAVTDGPYTIGAGGTVSNVLVTSEDFETIDVSALGSWTLVDSVVGVSSFDDDSQTNLGRTVESDAEYRARAEIERYRRALGPLLAIEANVRDVTGVTYVRAYHNIDPANDPDDANGIPLWGINVVVVGGDDTEVATAIEAAAPAGRLLYGTDVTVTLGAGAFTRDVSFDRVTTIRYWVRAIMTTSTSEEPQVSDLQGETEQRLLDYTAANWSIGTDVLPARLEGALADISGVDSVQVLISINGSFFDGNKDTINIRQQATLALADIEFFEV